MQFVNPRHMIVSRLAQRLVSQTGNARRDSSDWPWSAKPAVAKSNRHSRQHALPRLSSAAWAYALILVPLALLPLACLAAGYRDVQTIRGTALQSAVNE